MSRGDRSPWRVVDPAYDGPVLAADRNAGVLVVGAGVAGLATAQAVIRNTGLTCVVVERETVGSGASGNNAGHLASGYEVGYAALAGTRGVRATAQARAAVVQGRVALREIIRAWEVECDYQEVRSIVAYASPARLERDATADAELFPSDLRGGRYFLERPYLDSGAGGLRVRATPLDRVELAGTCVASFPAAGVREGMPTGLIHARAFCHSLACALTLRHPDRVAIYERSAFHGFEAADGLYRCRVGAHTVTARHLVFATNGYVPAPSPPTLACVIAPSLHCMLGFEIPPIYVAHAFGWYSDEPACEFFYGNVRIWRNGRHLLVLGGPDHLELDHASAADRRAFRRDSWRRLLDFARNMRLVSAGSWPDYRWCGVLGYSDGGLRLVTRDPVYPRVYHNSACNGVGLLLSCYGGERVVQLVSGAPDEGIFNRVGVRAS